MSENSAMATAILGNVLEDVEMEQRAVAPRRLELHPGYEESELEDDEHFKEEVYDSEDDEHLNQEEYDEADARLYEEAMRTEYFETQMQLLDASDEEIKSKSCWSVFVIYMGYITYLEPSLLRKQIGESEERPGPRPLVETHGDEPSASPLGKVALEESTLESEIEEKVEGGK